MQKHWRELVEGAGFPPPFIGGGLGQTPWWRRAQVEAWKDGARFDGEATPQIVEKRAVPANDPAPRPLSSSTRVSALLAAAGG